MEKEERRLSMVSLCGLPPIEQKTLDGWGTWFHSIAGGLGGFAEHGGSQESIGFVDGGHAVGATDAFALGSAFEAIGMIAVCHASVRAFDLLSGAGHRDAEELAGAFDGSGLN